MNTNQTIEALNTICPGWTEAQPGGMLCNPNAGGGIIDAEIKSGAWFVIFNDSRPNLEGYATREDAIEAFAIASRQPAPKAATAAEIVAHSNVLEVSGAAKALFDYAVTLEARVKALEAVAVAAEAFQKAADAMDTSYGTSDFLPGEKNRVYFWRLSELKTETANLATIRANQPKA